MKLKLNFHQASFTIESAFLLPLILITIFSFISFIFSLHDTVVTKALSYRLLISHSMNNSDYACTYYDSFTYDFASYAEQALIQESVPLIPNISANHLSITSSRFSIPVTLSNYNLTNLLLRYNQKGTLP